MLDRFPSMSKMKHSIFLVILLIVLAKHTKGQKPTKPNYFIQVCRPGFGNYTAGSSYDTNLRAVLRDLKRLTTSYPFSNASSGDGPDKVYGQYYCRADVQKNLCVNCIEAAAKSVLSNCPNSRAAIVWYEECTLRYENQSLAGKEAEYPRSWWSSTAPQNASTDPEVFSSLLGETIDGLINASAQSNNSLRFATGERRISDSRTVYCLVQCSPDMNATQCGTCLRSAFNFIPTCCGNSSAWLFVFYPVCQLRYSTVQPFYALPTPPTAQMPAFPPPAPESSPTLPPP